MNLLREMVAGAFMALLLAFYRDKRQREDRECQRELERRYPASGKE